MSNCQAYAARTTAIDIARFCKSVKERCAIHQIHAAAISGLWTKMLQRDRMQISAAFGGQNGRIYPRMVHKNAHMCRHFPFKFLLHSPIHIAFHIPIWAMRMKKEFARGGHNLPLLHLRAFDGVHELKFTNFVTMPGIHTNK